MYVVAQIHFRAVVSAAQERRQRRLWRRHFFPLIVLQHVLFSLVYYLELIVRDTRGITYAVRCTSLLFEKRRWSCNKLKYLCFRFGKEQSEFCEGALWCVLKTKETARLYLTSRLGLHGLFQDKLLRLKTRQNLYPVMKPPIGDLDSQGTFFEPWLRHGLRFLVVFFLSKLASLYFKLSHNRFVPNHHLTGRSRSVVD
jgi:hypothetical protein